MLTRGEALERLEGVTASLAESHRALADLSAAEHRARTETWFRSDAQHNSTRDRQADFNTLDLHDEISRVRGEIAALEASQFFLQMVIQYG